MEAISMRPTYAPPAILYKTIGLLAKTIPKPLHVLLITILQLIKHAETVVRQAQDGSLVTAQQTLQVAQTNTSSTTGTVLFVASFQVG